MDSMYENYYHGAHRPWAECSDCHLPHDNLVSYFIEKGGRGCMTSMSLGQDRRPGLIRLGEHSTGIIQHNCIRCHAEAVETIRVGVQPFERSCWEMPPQHCARLARDICCPPPDSSLYPLGREIEAMKRYPSSCLPAWSFYWQSCWQAS